MHKSKSWKAEVSSVDLIQILELDIKLFTSLRDGIAVWAPFLVTASAPAAAPNLIACSMGLPLARATANAPPNASPAAIESTAVTLYGMT